MTSERNRTRIGFKAKGSHYATDVLEADHSLIFGAQLQLAKGEQAFQFSGGMRIFERFGEQFAAMFRDPWVDAGAYDNVGLFFEDSVSVGGRLTLNLGVRYDRTAAESADATTTDGERVRGLGRLFTWNVVAPRAGFALDLDGDGKTVLRGGWGRFYSGVFTSDLGQGHPGRTEVSFADWDAATGDFTIPNPRRHVPVVRAFDDLQIARRSGARGEVTTNRC